LAILVILGCTYKMQTPGRPEFVRDLSTPATSIMQLSCKFTHTHVLLGKHHISWFSWRSREVWDLQVSL